MLGVITGLIYGLLAVGLALLYKSTRVINFAHAEVGALAAAVMAVLTIDHGVPYLVALLAALGLAAGISIATERIIIRRLERAPRLVVMVATIGLSQVLLAANVFPHVTGCSWTASPCPSR